PRRCPKLDRLMLSFSLHLPDLAAPAWRWRHDRWTTGTSWITPLRHPVVIHSFRQQGATAAERGAEASNSDVVGHSGTVAVRSVECGDSLLVEMCPGQVLITAGVTGTAPLYLVATGETLEASWNITDLRTRMRPDDLLDRAVARVLTRQHRYSADTLFSTITRLTERAIATFTTSGLQLSYPPDALHVAAARRLREGADPLTAFAALLTEVIRPWRLPECRIGVELSGGLDSASVAVTLADIVGPTVETFGVLVDGDTGIDQRQRRVCLVDRIRARDSCIDASDHPPFGPTGIRATGHPHDPSGEFYREVFEALADTACAQGIRVMFTGIGGDEIMALHANEQADRPPSLMEEVPWLGERTRRALCEVDDNLAPVAPIPLPSLMAFAIHHPAYLRARIWPVAPLANPNIVRFAEQLPEAWRGAKNLQREYLRRAGLSAVVTHPTRPENFRQLMQTGLRRHGLPLLDRLLREGMLLADTGFVDPAALRVAAHLARSTPTVRSVLCDTLALELGLRSLLRNPRR
ncbi:MAG: asparagine synthase-related protein, partial [Pseudonocardiaceae bacterium]